MSTPHYTSQLHAALLRAPVVHDGAEIHRAVTRLAGVSTPIGLARILRADGNLLPAPLLGALREAQLPDTTLDRLRVAFGVPR